MISTILNILGSLGIFLFGMKIMSEGIQKTAGNRLRSILAYMTQNRVAGVFTGFLTTCLVQSSSATTVMVVSFVNAGLLTLVQSIGIIMGANIGTTITGWLVTVFGFKFKILSIALPAVGIGLPLIFSKITKRKNWGEIFVGFGLLFLGLKFLKDETAENGVNQVAVLGGIVYGNTHNEHWSIESKPVDFFDAKGDVEALIALTNDLSRFSFKAEVNDGLHPGQSAAIYLDDKKVGFIGAVHPQLQKSLGLNNVAFVFEIEADALVARKLPEAVSVSKFPSNRRDIAILVADEVKIGDILNSIEKVGGNQLVDLNLFDVYKGQGIEPGFKSLALALTLQADDKTLEESDINLLVDNVVAELANKFNASLRD